MVSYPCEQKLRMSVPSASWSWQMEQVRNPVNEAGTGSPLSSLRPSKVVKAPIWIASSRMKAAVDRMAIIFSSLGDFYNVRGDQSPGNLVVHIAEDAMKQALGVSGRRGGLEAAIPQHQVVGNQQPLHAVRHGQREREVARATTMEEGCFEVRAAGPS